MKKFIFSGIIASFVLLSCLASAVQAITYNYSYSWNSGGVLAGMLEGTLRDDDNTVEVTSIMGSYTPGNGPAPFDLTYSDVFATGGGPALVTLDGSNFNLFTGTSLFRNVEFFIHSGFNSSSLFDPPAPTPNTGVKVEAEGISATRNGWVASERWSLTEKTAVPEPSTLLLFGTGMLSLLAWARRQKKLAAISPLRLSANRKALPSGRRG